MDRKLKEAIKKNRPAPALSGFPITRTWGTDMKRKWGIEDMNRKKKIVEKVTKRKLKSARKMKAIPKTNTVFVENLRAQHIELATKSRQLAELHTRYSNVLNDMAAEMRNRGLGY